jgi:photosystem II stability/assembly factor-like uncharacterized protein
MANRVSTLSLALCFLGLGGCLTLWSCGRAEEPAPKQPAAAQPAAAPQPPAQQAVVAEGYLRNLPRKNVDDLTFEDFKSAFDTQARNSPAPRETVIPTRTFEPEGATLKRAAEEENLYKRWEWFTQPRVYPTGRWDNSKVFTEMSRVATVDTDLRGRVALPENAKVLPKWSPLGPSDAVGNTNLGRVNAIAFDPTTANTIYIGSADGGLWKSTTSGTAWTPLTDALPTLSIGDIAIDPSAPKTIYIATGDAFGYGNPFWGGTYSMGVWKSLDGGNVWLPTGLTLAVGQTRTIRRLAINPTNPKILLAATSAGLFRTTDAGLTWNSLWATSTFDVEFNPSDGNIVYATTNQVLKSTNAGASFTPTSATCGGSRYNIEVAKSNPNTLYTLCTNATVQKSTDAGSTWSTTTAPGVTLYGYYDNVLAVSPADANIVIVAGFDMKKTTNGGTTWASVPTAGHVDNHCVRFAPGSSTTILGGNDGGLFRTTNGGTSWTSLNKGLAITQFYRVGLSKLTPTLMVAGAQDNGNMKLNGAVWSNITNADGMGGFIDFANNNNVYATIQYGALFRSTNGGSTWTGINTPGGGAWVTPFMQSRTVANTIYAGTDKVYKSTNQGTTWTAISGALAGVGQVTVLRLHTNPNYILAGSGAKLYRTTNAGSTWTDITGTLPVAANFLMDAVMNDNDPQMIWATFSGYTAGQKVYKSTDGGATWTNISGILPNIPVNCIVYENKAGNPIYVGTDAGVYYIKDGLPAFLPFKLGLPNVIIDELEIHVAAKKIVAATYGRGLWQSPLMP